jgi:glycosyltransferase involved in cell wall biosynthesis
MKKVFRIIGRLNIGGPAIHTILLTHHLNSGRYKTRLIAGVEGPSEGNLRYLAEERGVEPLIISEMGREISLRDDIIALFKLIALMRREKPDIIHTHTAKAGTLGRLAALLALPGRRKQIYHTFHGHVFHSYFSARKTRVFIRIEQFLARFTHRLIAVSERTRQELIAYKIASAEKIICIPLGLDLEPFAQCERYQGELRRELGLSADAVLIGLVARLVPIKGLHDFLTAASCVVASVPNAWFVLVGDGEMRQELEDHARALGLMERIRFLGYRQDLARIYADLDIVTLSSLNEGLPVSLIEAMSSGCVVVSTAVGGVPDLIEDKQTGFLVPPHNPAALAYTLEHVIASPECWPAITKRARESALTQFHISRLVADIERLYAGGEN